MSLSTVSLFHHALLSSACLCILMSLFFFLGLCCLSHLYSSWSPIATFGPGGPLKTAGC